MLSFTSYYYFSRTISKPLRKVENALKKVKDYNFATCLPVQQKDEVGTLSSGFNKMSNYLKDIFHSAQIITSLLTFKELLISFIKKCISFTASKKGAFIIYNLEKKLEIFTSDSLDLNIILPSELLEKLLTGNEQFFLYENNLPGSGKKDLSFLYCPLFSNREILGWLYLEKKYHDRMLESEQINLLKVYISQAIIVIENEMQKQKLKEYEVVIDEEKVNTICRAYEITQREKEIIIMAIQGATKKEISNQLFVSFGTVKKHFNNIYKKIKVNNRQDLVKLFLG